MNDKNVEHKPSQDGCPLKGTTKMGNLFSKQLSDDPDHKQENSESEAENAPYSPNDFQPSSPETSNSDTSSNMEPHPDMILLNAILSDICCLELTPQKTWSALQHYIYFLYRHVVSVKPYNNSDTIPDVICRAISEIFDNLLEIDTTQVCLKLISLLRDYILVARSHIDNIQSSNVATYLVTLMAYYSALCSSAGKCAPLLPEFDFLTLGRFNINWIGINKSIFYHHIYLSPNVQAKIPLFIKLKKENNPSLKGLLETYVCFTQDMQALATKWTNLRMQITNASKNRARANPKKYLLKDWKMFSEHKKIFNSAVWMNRNSKVMKIQDMNELDAHILAWVADKSSIPESLIDDKGCCLCEDCLSAEFRNNSMGTALAQSYRSEISAKCLISCYICQDPIVLDTLFNHILTQHTRTSENGEQGFSSPFQRPQKSSSKESSKMPDTSLYEGLLEKNAEIKRSLLQLIDGTSSQRNKLLRGKNKKDSTFAPTDAKEKSFQASNKHKPTSRNGSTLFPFKQSSQPSFPSNENLFSKDIILKLATESPAFQNGDDTVIIDAANSAEECKIFLEQMKKITENEIENGRFRNKTKVESSITNTDSESINTDGSKVFPLLSEKTTNTSNISEEDLVAAAIENGSFRKPQQKPSNSTIDAKVLEFLKTANANAHKAAAASAKPGEPCAGHACGHKCKQEEELKKMNCMDSCDHHKDSRKCDCAYCEVFGSAFPPNAPKASETRDRLRTRLNQRKEKVNENVDGDASKTTPTNSKSIKPTGNCIIKICKSPKVPVANGKPVSVTAKIVKAVSTEPPRVPELHHPVPPPGNTKAVQIGVEVKKPAVSIDKQAAPNITKASVGTQLSSSAPETTIDNSSEQRSSSSLSTCSLFSEPVDCRDINELLNYIEGNKTVDKVAIAHKKAAKKARQRSRKAQEREEKERIELEKQKLREKARLREEKLKEEERRKAEIAAKQLAEKQNKCKKDDKSLIRQESKKGSNKKGNKQEHVVKLSATTKIAGKGSKLMEETIPAMVTIKRASEGNNSQATVTITLKGSTPDTDKLLFTLVNGTETSTTTTIKENIIIPNKSKGKTNASNKSNQPSSAKGSTENVKPSKKKQEKENTSVTKPMKVTIAVDKNNTNKKENSQKKIVKTDTFASHQLQQAFNNNKECDSSYVKAQNNAKAQSNAKEEISLPMLNLPPGITITKIDGPPNTGNCKYNNPHGSQNSYHNQNQTTNIPSSKSGVIVVDTEKLIQQSIAASISKRDKKMNKKKREQKPTTPTKTPENAKAPDNPPSMITIKNPIFDLHHNNRLPEKSNLDFPDSQQASIFKGENGMVTIRSPRLQNPFDNGAPVSSYFSDIQPMYCSDFTPPYMPVQQQSNFYTNTNNSQFSQYNSHYHAHEFLAGLPGIEITKINKAAASEIEDKRVIKPPSKTSVPTNNVVNNVNTLNFDADEWYYESVFKPREDLEEDMDDEELELEEFKRFCHQSIPITRKDNVTNLNTRDIAYTKNDVSYA